MSRAYELRFSAVLYSVGDFGGFWSQPGLFCLPPEWAPVPSFVDYTFVSVDYRYTHSSVLGSFQLSSFIVIVRYCLTEVASKPLHVLSAL